MHKQRLPTPWDGVPGFWAALNRFFYPITGPAQLGAGRVETAYVRREDAACPICGQSMADHVREVVEGDQRTLLHCPRPS